MLRAPTSLLMAGLLWGCTPSASGAGSSPGDAPLSSVSVTPVASRPATPAPSPAVARAASDDDKDDAASSWQTACLARVTASRGPAAAIHPEFARAAVESERVGESDRVTMFMFPPTWHAPAFHLTVTRGQTPGVDRPEHPWQRRAEVLGGSYHAMILRQDQRTTASITFDGWSSPQVDQLAPILTQAVDDCFTGN